MAATDPSLQFFSQQNIVAPKADDYYGLIKEIDAYRSRFDSNTVNFDVILSSKGLDRIIAQNYAVSETAQESRCNTFFRMIGLPVVSEDNQIYSPGFDPELNRNKDRIGKKLDIARAVWDKLGKGFAQRELYPQDTLKIFKQQNSAASALAISSIFPRPFEDQLKPGIDPHSIDAQNYVVPDRLSVISDFSSDSSFFQSLGDVDFSSTHLLKPFMVDPRVDLTVNPAHNLICAPFLLDKSKTQISSNNYLKRPYIEKVIRQRFDPTNPINKPSDTNTADGLVQDLLSYVKNKTDITDPTLLDQVFNPLKQLHRSEIVMFGKFIQIIEALLSSMRKAYRDIERTRYYMNWKPIPNVRGPEFGCTLNDIVLTDTANKQPERDIIDQRVQKLLNTTEFDIGLANTDVGNFTFSNIDDIINDASKANAQLQDKQITQLTRRRDENGNSAINALREIEIITGEFSGLGLLDIFAVQAALWIMDPKALLGLLDFDVIARMQTIPNLTIDTTGDISPTDAMIELEKKISEVYVLMGAFYKNIVLFDAKNRR